MKDKSMVNKMDLHLNRANFGICYNTTAKTIYAFGGHSEFGCISHCERYDVEKDEWKVIAPMFKKRENPSACVLNDKFVYVIGGGYFGKMLNDIDNIDIASDTWKTMKIESDLQMTPRLKTFSFQINSSSIIIAGGFGGGQDSFIYDTNRNTLKKANDLPKAGYFTNHSTI